MVPSVTRPDAGSLSIDRCGLLFIISHQPCWIRTIFNSLLRHQLHFCRSRTTAERAALPTKRGKLEAFFAF